MKWLSRIITLVLFIFFFVLALKNTQETALYFFWGYELRGPLVLIVLCFFVAGAFLGLMTMIPVVSAVNGNWQNSEKESPNWNRLRKRT